MKRTTTLLLFLLLFLPSFLLTQMEGLNGALLALSDQASHRKLRINKSQKGVSNRVVICHGEDIVERTKRALEILAPKLPPKGSKVLIKPNLVEPMEKGSGAVTRPEIVEGIVQYLGDSNYRIIIGESSAVWKTWECFERAGYRYLEEKYRVKLVNFDEEEHVAIGSGNPIWPEIEIAKLAYDCDYLISAAPLKEHSYGVSLTLKNMMGVIRSRKELPTKGYMHQEGDPEIWAERLVLLIEQVKPDLAIIDATTGMYGSHLHGRLKQKDLTIAGEDPLAVDIAGAEILGHKRVFYLEKMLKREMGRIPLIEAYQPE